MSAHPWYSLPKETPVYLLILTSGLALGTSVISLSSGFTTIFQNLYYFPIIIACAYYHKRGFLFSLLLIVIYGVLMLMFTTGTDVFIGVLIRMVIFTIVAGTVTYLSYLRLSSIEVIRKSEQKYRHLFDSSDAGVALHEIICDESKTPVDYRFLEVNPAFERITGLHASDIIGKTVREVLPGIEPYWIEMYGEVALTTRSNHFENYSQDLGKYYDVTVYAPEIGQFATLIYEITDRKKQENLLKESNAYLENLITFANVPIIVWNPDFQITRTNHAFEILIGRSSEEIIGQPFTILVPQDKGEHALRLIRTTMSGVRWESVEIPIVHQDGSIRQILWNSSTLYRPDGRYPVATIAQGRDITGERILEQEKAKTMIQIQENIAQLAILNDGIRNPLTIITTYSDMSGNQQLSELILDAVMQIDTMVNNLDRKWVQSVKILDHLRKQNQIAADFIPELSSQAESAGTLAGAKPDLQITHIARSTLFIEEIKAQLYTILDSMDALVYVTDMETYDILYLNEQGRAAFGNVTGQKCYNYIHGDIASPCPFCTNNRLVHEGEPTGVYRWEYEDTQNGRWYDCRDRAIRWSDGRWVRLEIATDITKRTQIERSLRESEHKYRLLADNIGDVIWTAGEEMNLTYVSPSITSLTGYSPEEFITLRPEDSLTPESFFRLYNSRQEVLNTIHSGFHDQCRPVVLELEYRTKNGSTVITETNISLILTSGGSPQGVIGVTRDITARKLAEEALRENEKRYREIFESLDDLYYQTDENGIITVLSPSVYPLSGWNVQELIGKHVEDLYVHTEDRAVLFSLISQKGYIRDYELLMRKKDGTPIPISLSGSVILKPDGTHGGLRGSLRDISGRKQAEEDLRESEERYRLLHENAGIGIGYYTPDGMVISYNLVAARHMGGYPEDFAGKSVFELFQQEEAEHYYERILKAAGTEESAVYEDLVHLPSGDQYFLSTFTRITGSGGRVVGIQIISQDVTEQKRNEVLLIRERERLEGILKGTNTGTWEWNVQTGETVFNERWAEIIGYTVEELSPVSIEIWMKFCHPDDLKLSEELLNQHFYGEIDYYECEARMLHKNGDWVWVLDRGRVISWDLDGRPLVMMGTHQDISDRKRAEEALATSEAKYRSLFDNAILGIFRTTPEGRYLDMNPAFARIAGYNSPEEMMADIHDIGKQLYVRVEDRQKIGELLKRDAEIRSFETEIRHRDGHSIWISINAAGVRSKNNSVLWWEGTIEEISARKLAESELVRKNEELYTAYEQMATTSEELRNNYEELTASRQLLAESEEKFRRLTEDIPACICTFLSDGTITYVNQALADLSGMTPDEMTGTIFYNRLSPEVRRKVETGLASLCIESPYETHEQIHTAPDNSQHTIQWTNRAFFDDSDHIVSFQAVGTDITTLKQIEEALKESRDLLDETQKISRLGGWEWDVTRQIMKWTNETYRIHGMSPGEVLPYSTEYIKLSLACYDIVDRPVIETAFKRCIEEGVGYDFEFPFTRIDGQRIWIRTMAHAVKERGRIIRVIGTIMDITENRQIRQALRESEKKYREIFNSTSEAIMLDDINTGKIIDVNKTTLRMYGYNSKEDILAGSIGDLSANVTPYDEAEAQRRIQKSIEEGVQVFEWLAKKQDGKIFWVEVSLRKTEIGGTGRILAVVRDISRRKQVEEELQASEKRFRSILQNVTTVAVQGYAMDGTVHYWNSASETLYGYTAEEVVNRNLLDLIIPPSMRDEVKSAITHMADTGEVIPACELLLMRKDGTLIPVFSSHVIVKIPGKDAELFCIDIDLTERKRAEDALRENEERFRLLVKNSSDIIICIDASGIQRYLSPAVEQITGFTADELEGKNLVDNIHPEDIETVMHVWENCILQPEAIFTLQYRHTHKTRGWVYLETTAQNFLNIPAVSAIVGSIRDITDRKQSEEALYASNQKLRLLTSLTRHDVSNKLTAIHLLFDLASEESNPKKRDDYIMKFRHAVEQVESIIKFTREYEDFGVVASRWQQVQSLIWFAASETDHTGVLVDTTIPPDIQIFADPIIQKVFTTLVENAVRHAGNLTQIIFSCSREDGHIIIICEDDGSGIPQEEKEIIFENGYGKNTGLGLFLSREILAITGLTIKETGYLGARFEIFIPEGKWRREYVE